METFAPLVELTRGPLVESIHFGVIAVVDQTGRLVAHAGDEGFIANLRSSAKPFQALSMVESGAPQRFGLSDEEIAISCASHSGTDRHAHLLEEMQARLGVSEADLLCGVHYPMYEPAARMLRQRGETPTANRHNCSGKHTGMLANALARGFEITDYLNTDHPVQQVILRGFAEMTGQDPAEVPIGIDGCSAPTFAAPMRNAAHAYALLADPTGLSPVRAEALRRIYLAMTRHPFLVAGPDRFDTAVMQAGAGRIVSKGGAEGYQGMGIRPDVLFKGSPALGITYKIIDGDQTGRANGVIATAIFDQLGLFRGEDHPELVPFQAHQLVNAREIHIGEIRPAFRLDLPAEYRVAAAA